MTDRARLPSRPRLIALAIAVAALGAAAVYAGGQWSNGGDRECRTSAPLAARLRPLAKGEVAAVGVPPMPQSLPALHFAGPQGEPTTLADFRGRIVLLNLWATWCVPCRAEMPALDRLEAGLGGPDFAIVAVNMDTRDPEKPKNWLKDNNISRLTYYADPDGGVFQALRTAGRATGLPTTLILDRSGCMVAHLDGPADWGSEGALALVRAAIAP